MYLADFSIFRAGAAARVCVCALDQAVHLQSMSEHMSRLYSNTSTAQLIVQFKLSNLYCLRARVLIS